ncbi:hypothetical protein GGS26DRAFT_599332 [Hypomontagnella submonticulosa]|nr:hypothetical protein GGS26DRAFT_599332 [Hypomontagnella submonticulosa]
MCCTIRKQPQPEAPMNADHSGSAGSARSASSASSASNVSSTRTLIGGRFSGKKPQLRVFGRRRPYDWFYPAVSDGVQPGESSIDGAKRARQFANLEGTSGIAVTPIGSPARPIAVPKKVYTPSGLRHEVVHEAYNEEEGITDEEAEGSAGQPQGWEDDPNVEIPEPEGEGEQSEGCQDNASREAINGSQESAFLRGGDTGDCCHEPCGCVLFWCGKICGDD